MNRKITLLCVLVVGLTACYLLYVHLEKQKQAATTQQTTPQTVPNIVKTNIDSSQLPDKFPKEIPLEENVKVIQNYNITSPDGRFQATRIFESKKSLAENQAIYRTWMNKEGYEIRASSDKPEKKMLLGSKGNSKIQVSIYENKSQKTNVVNISFTQNNSFADNSSSIR